MTTNAVQKDARQLREFADLPKAVIPLLAKEQIAIAALRELAELRILDCEVASCVENFGIVRVKRRELAIGCTVKSSKSYRGKTGKLIEFKQNAGITFGMILFAHGLPLYPCRLSDLEVVECN